MNRSKAPLAMMEQVMMVLCFAMAAAICLRIFVRTGLGSLGLESQDRMLSLAQTAADAYMAGDAQVFDRLGLDYAPGESIARQAVRDGGRFEAAGLELEVDYAAMSPYLWEAVVMAFDSGGDVCVIRIAGQLDGR